MVRYRSFLSCNWPPNQVQLAVNNRIFKETEILQFKLLKSIFDEFARYKKENDSMTPK